MRKARQKAKNLRADKTDMSHILDNHGT